MLLLLNIGKCLTVYLLSMFKFVGGPLAGVGMDLPLYQTVLFTVAGMMTSVLVFSWVGERVHHWYQARRKRKRKVFSKRSRRIVKIWLKFGVQGIAFITPLLLTPIGGTIVAVLLGAKRGRLWLWMLGSSVFWALVLTFSISIIKGS